MRLKELPTELILHIHSFHDTYREDFKNIILPEFRECMKQRFLEKVLLHLSKLQIDEAYNYVMDDNQFNYELVKQEPLLVNIDKGYFMNRIRMKKCWNT